MARGTRLLLAHLLSASLAVAGCSADPTELVVVVDTDYDVPAELDAVSVSVEGPSGVRQEDSVALGGAGAPELPLILYLEAGGGALEPVSITATGRFGGEDVVARAIRTGFVRGESRLVGLLLLAGCAGVECGAGESCSEDGCVSVDVPAAALPRWPGRVRRLDAGAPVADGGADAGPTDAGADACMPRVYYQDTDRDGFGSAATPSEPACSRPAGYVSNDLDCDDSSASIHPSASEVCGGVDENCDGMEDEGFECSPGDTRVCTTDCGSTGLETCSSSCGFGACVEPAEICNGLDDDCDGAVDEELADCGNTCVTAVVVREPVSIRESTCGSPDDADLACGEPGVPDDVYVVTLTDHATVDVDLDWNGRWDVSGNLSYRGSSCPGTEVACAPREESISRALPPGDHYFVVEDATGGCDDYVITFTF